MTIYFRSTQVLVALTAFLISLPTYSEHLDDAIKIETKANVAAINSQEIVDVLSDKTRKMLDQYRSASHQAETLQIYNKHLETLLSSQKEEKLSLQSQLNEIETTQREIVPLILRMMDSLDKFITLDLPFLPEERKQRVAKLKEMVVRADISHAEKFRRILEAYQIENDYGNTIEAYRADLELDGVRSSVDFLRLGRVSLYYQRFDGSETGYWDKKNKQWKVLSDDYRISVRNGLRVARKETAPDILTLPIPVAEAGQ